MSTDSRAFREAYRNLLDDIQAWKKDRDRKQKRARRKQAAREFNRSTKRKSA